MASRRFSSQRRRGMDWKSVQYGGNLVANGIVCDWAVEPSAIALEFTEPTLTATRGVVVWNLDEGGSLLAFAGFGIIEWGEGVSGLPPTDCPDPILNGSHDWIWRAVYPVPIGTPANTHFYLNENEKVYLSEAQRRLETGNGLLMVASVDGAVDGSFSADFRFLLKDG